MRLWAFFALANAQLQQLCNVPLQGEQYMQRAADNAGERLVQNNNLEPDKIDLDKQWKFNFQLKLDGGHVDWWRSILHVIKIGDFKVCGDRYPGMWIIPWSQGALQICSCISADKNTCIDLPEMITPLKSWTRWEIGQSGFGEDLNSPIYYYVKFNGREIYKTQNLLPIIKRRLNVFAGDNIYPAADGNMRYLMYSRAPAGYDLESCQQPAEPWSEWTECSKSCGGGSRSRTMYSNDQPITDMDVCNTHLCPIIIEKLITCHCPYVAESVLSAMDNEEYWYCNAPHMCPPNYTCQRTYMTQQKHHCVPEVAGTCLAWGDPHITTFDQVWTGVNGVGIYQLAKSKLDDRFEWDVTMKTVSALDSYGSVIENGSVAKSIKVHFKSDKIEWFVEGTYEGLTVTFSTDDPNYTEKKLRDSLHIEEEGSQLIFQTWFGLKIGLRNQFISVKPALAYSEHVNGACATYDFDLTNEHALENGEIGTREQYEDRWAVQATKAKGQMITDNQCPEAAICDKFFSETWLSPCFKYVSIIQWLEMCKVEVCKRPEEAEDKAKKSIVDYVLECGRHNPQIAPVCTWARELDLPIAKCPFSGENRQWNGCILRCDSLRECGDLGCYVHPLFPIYVYGCFCSPGHVLQPGTNECIPVAQCDAVQTTRNPLSQTTPPDTICHSDECLRISSYIMDVKIYKKCFNPHFKALKKERAQVLKAINNPVDKKLKKKEFKVDQRNANQLYKERAVIKKDVQTNLITTVMRDEVSTCPFVVCQHWFDTPGAFRIYKKCSRKNNQAMKKAAKAMIEAGLNLQLNVMTGRMATPLPRPTGFVMQAARMGRPTQPAPTKKTTTFRWAKGHAPTTTPAPDAEKQETTFLPSTASTASTPWPESTTFADTTTHEL